MGKKTVDIFEKSIHFLILCIVLKNETSLPPGAFAPSDPLRGARDSLYVAGASPPQQNPGDATAIEL